MNISFPSKETLASFFKTGLLIMSASLLLTIVLKTSPELRSADSDAVLSDAPIQQIPTDSPRVVLSFNTSLQEPENLDALLSLLQEQKVSASFFLSDAWIKQYPEEVKAISSAGHDVGYLLEYSGNSQGSLDNGSMAADAARLADGAATLSDLAGTRCCYFRPALGEYDKKLLTEAKKQKLSCILWNMDSQDWKDYDANALTSLLLQHPQLENGSILLFRCSSKHLLEALPFIIQGLRDMGYEPASLSGLLNSGT